MNLRPATTRESKTLAFSSLATLIGLLTWANISNCRGDGCFLRDFSLLISTLPTFLFIGTCLLAAVLRRSVHYLAAALIPTTVLAVVNIL